MHGGRNIPGLQAGLVCFPFSGGGGSRPHPSGPASPGHGSERATPPSRPCKDPCTARGTLRQDTWPGPLWDSWSPRPVTPLVAWKYGVPPAPGHHPMLPPSSRDRAPSPGPAVCLHLWRWLP